MSTDQDDGEGISSSTTKVTSTVTVPKTVIYATGTGAITTARNGTANSTATATAAEAFTGGADRVRIGGWMGLAAAVGLFAL